MMTLALAGCAPLTPAPEPATSVMSVRLPLGLAGIADSRQDFAALFESEWHAGSARQGERLGDWLHGVSPSTEAANETLAALRAAFAARAAGTSVLVVPGLFGDCVDSQSVPFGDGVVRTRERSTTEAYLQYGDLGLAGIRSISLPGRETSIRNGLRLAEQIRLEAARPGVTRIVLVAYSKGVPDALHALDQLQAEGGIPVSVMALVSVAGVVMGTPFADHFEPLFETLSPHWQPLDCSPSDGREVSSVTRRERVAWLQAHPLPAGLRYYSIVAHAPRQEIGVGLRAVYTAMSVLDARNDGQLFASDAILPGSILLAEVRADHWDVALPRDRHPSAIVRAVGSGRAYPREALFRATIQWVVGMGH